MTSGCLYPLTLVVLVVIIQQVVVLMSTTTASTTATTASTSSADASVVDCSFASQALALSVQHWMDLGRGQDPVTGTPESIEDAAVRITNIFLIRLIAMHHSHRLEDLSTSSIAVAVLNDAESAAILTEQLTPSLMLQLETYITCMLYGYTNDLPFHNYQHAYHVCISANKFVEGVILSSTNNKKSKNKDKTQKSRDGFGLACNPLYLMALLFAALIHDVGHTGVSNFQRAQDDPELAATYNDPSLHEHYSLQIAFEELLKEEYAELREVMFKDTSYFEAFRQLVSDAVLSTDIADPFRAEEAKLKYFSAFPNAGCEEEESRRSSIASNISMPRAPTQRNRRVSGQTIGSSTSDLTMDTMNQGDNSKRGAARRHSSEFAAESIRMTREDTGARRASDAGCTGNIQQRRRLSTSHSSDTGLVALAQDVRRDANGTRKDSSRLGLKSRTQLQQKSKISTNLELVGDQEDELDSDSSLSLSDDEFDGPVETDVSGQTSKKPSEDIVSNDSLSPSMSTKAEREGRRTTSNFVSIQEDSAQESGFTNGRMIGIASNPDHLQAVVVVELFLRASDVAHWYQGWDTMIHFNRRVFQELDRASSAGRGFDPRPKWFDNQAKIMETYMLPLAEQIDYLGVLLKGSGIDLVGSLESNSDLWLVRGLEVVEALKTEAN